MLLNPIYHDCRKWEDWKNHMFRSVSKKGDDILIEKSITLLSNQKLLYDSMVRVITEWPIATEERLTKQDTNRRAWLGWAACSINHNAPDFITRKAWGCLDSSSQQKANLIADKVILEWESINNKKEEDACQLSLCL